MALIRFGEFIHQRRRELGMDTQVALAARLQLDKSQVNRIEKGIAPSDTLRRPLIEQLADVLYLKLDEFAKAALDGWVEPQFVCNPLDLREWKSSAQRLLEAMREAEMADTALLRSLLQVQSHTDFPLSRDTFLSLIRDFCSHQH